MSTVFELLRSRMRERTTSTDETLVAAANRLAADETVDHAAVEKALRDSGRGVDDFERMCELARRRRDWRQRADRGAVADTKLAKLTATLEKESGQFETIRIAWLQRSAELGEEIRQAENASVAGGLARGELVRPQNVPGALGELLAEAHKALGEASSVVSQLGRELRDTRELERSHRTFAEQKAAVSPPPKKNDPPDDYTVRADRAAKRAAALAEELEAATATEAEAAERVRVLEARALKL